MMNKKGAELSINVIIVAVLGLLILAVLIYIASGKLGDFRESVDQCSGTCVDSANKCPEAAIPMKCDANAPKVRKYCCVSLGDGDS